METLNTDRAQAPEEALLPEAEEPKLLPEDENDDNDTSINDLPAIEMSCGPDGCHIGNAKGGQA